MLAIGVYRRYNFPSAEKKQACAARGPFVAGLAGVSLRATT